MEIMPNKNFAMREIIFREGDAPDGVYYICSGRVEVSRNISGEETVIAELEEGDVFGEMAVVDDRPRAGTVIASEDLWVHHFTVETFKRKMESMDKILSGVFLSLVLNIRNMNYQHDELQEHVRHLQKELLELKSASSSHGE